MSVASYYRVGDRVLLECRWYTGKATVTEIRPDGPDNSGVIFTVDIPSQCTSVYKDDHSEVILSIKPDGSSDRAEKITLIRVLVAIEQQDQIEEEYYQGLL